MSKPYRGKVPPGAKAFWRISHPHRNYESNSSILSLVRMSEAEAQHLHDKGVKLIREVTCPNKSRRSFSPLHVYKNKHIL